MLRLSVRLKRSAIFVHRWMGVAFCLLFAWWFITGMFMMYWDYPEVTEADRLARAQPLDTAHVRIAPQQAYAALHDGLPANTVELVMFDGRPVYRFAFSRGDQRLVHADDGTEITEFRPEMLLRVAASWTGKPAREAHLEGVLTTEDQWTVAGSFRALRPLWKYSWQGGEEVYVSEVTGQVEQYTTRGSRIGAYLGAIPHWLYFTPLRRNGRVWSRIVIGASALATVAALFGLIVGVWMFAPSRSIPYKGQKRLHVILGLFFGVVACTWAFSGMLSMEPFPIQGEDRYAAEIAGALRGGSPALDLFDKKPLPQVFAEAAHLKQLEFGSFAGEPVYLATEDLKHQRLIAVGDAPVDSVRIMAVLRKAVPVAEGVLRSDYDAYYLDRHHQRPLPVLLVRLSDPENSRYYIDPRTARIVGAYSSASWMSRWLYHGLHSIDIAWLYRNRPAWDLVVLILLAGGAALSITAVTMAWQFVRRKLL